MSDLPSYLAPAGDPPSSMMGAPSSAALDLSRVQTLVKTPPPEFPLGARGDRPLWVKLPFAVMTQAQTIPGVVGCPQGGVLAPWHAVPALRREFPTLRLPEPPAGAMVPLKGLVDFQRLKLAENARPFQPPMMEFLARRSEAICGDPLRSGKTYTTLGAATAIGARKNLVVCPALAKLVWAGEIATFLHEEALLLYGRAGTEARWYCLACAGSGLVNKGADPCPACRARNGSSYGDRIVQPAAELKAFRRRNATDDAHARLLDDLLLREQRELVAQAIDKARWVIVNYDCLTRQEGAEDTGKAKDNAHLPGWVETLTRFAWDLVIPDEAHYLAGRGTAKRQGKSRRDRFVMLCEMVPRFWGVTGTPIVAESSDGWGVADAVTNHTVGTPRQWDIRYAGAEIMPAKVKDGVTIVPAHWECMGETRIDELRERLAVSIWKRERKDIMAGMPPKTRTVQRVEVDQSVRLSRRAGLMGALAQTCRIKLPFIVGQVMEEVSQGLKVVVFTWAVEHARMYEAEIRKVAAQKTWGPRVRARNFQSWLITGDVSPDARAKMARTFVAHGGAGVVVASMQAVPGMVSFKGASVEHYAELHWNPTILEQTEDRAYEIGTTGLQIVYWVAKGTIDERVVANVLPKMRTKESLEGSTAGKDFVAAFEGPKQTEDEIAQEIWNQTLSSMPTVVEDDGD